VALAGRNGAAGGKRRHRPGERTGKQRMSWGVIATTDLQAYLIDVQYQAIASGGTAIGQAAPFGVVMPDVVNTIRNIIAKKGKPISVTANQVPPEARTHAIWLIIDALQTRIPGLIVTAEQKRHVDDAHAFILELGQPSFAVSLPSDPVYPDVDIGSGISVVSSSTSLRTFSSRSMDGLL
jgi:hypothetical protein